MGQNENESNERSMYNYRVVDRVIELGRDLKEFDNGGLKTASQVARQREKSQSTIHQKVQYLKNLGILEEENEVGPRGEKYFSLTPKGKEVSEKIEEIKEVLNE